MENPFRAGWSLRLGPLRLRSLPWYWEVLRERLVDSSASQRPVAAPPAHHAHYCEECDRQWIHAGHTCAQPWALPCPETKRPDAGTARHRLGSWLIVVRRDRTELGRHLGAGFEADPRVTVVVDRRRVDRRVRGAERVWVTLERRQRRDRRAAQGGEDGSLWASLGFRVLPARSPDPR